MITPTPTMASGASLVALELSGDRIAAMDGVRPPDKLGHLR
jgi:hypothetical protein